jgi:hypothetical protein
MAGSTTIEDLTLKRTDRTGVLNVLQKEAFDPLDFEWESTVVSHSHLGQVSRHRVSVLRHQSTGYYFRFGRYDSIWSPGWQLKTDSGEWTTLNKRFDQVKEWLSALKDEVDAPDLWASIGQEKVLSTAASSKTLDNRPFIAAEQNLIATKLDEIKGYILEGQHLATEQVETVEREFAYLKESSERLGRKDWLNVLLGALVSLAIGLALDPEKARGLLRLAGAVFQSLFGTAHGYLP